MKIYTDGARKKVGIGGWSAVIDCDNVTVLGGFLPQTTNNICELTGPIHGLRHANKMFVDAEIISDSEYFVKGFNSWMHSWFDKDGNHVKKMNLKNSGLWRELHSLKLNNKATWVRGHADNIGNIIADVFANAYCYQIIDGPMKFLNIDEAHEYARQLGKHI